MQEKSELYVITAAKKLAQYIIQITSKSPKSRRYTISDRIQNHAIDVSEYIYLANECELGSIERIEYQNKARREIRLLSYVVDNYANGISITKDQAKFISEQVANIILYLNKWIDSDKRRISTNKVS